VNALLVSIRQRLRPQQTERRTFTRFATGIDAEIAVVFSGPTLSMPDDGFIEDISGGGLRVRMGHDFPKGTRLRIAFAFPGEAEHASAAVEVVASEAAGDHFVAHCRFVELRRSAFGWQLLNWAIARQAEKDSHAAAP
jgi:hypothetical protein